MKSIEIDPLSTKKNNNKKDKKRPAHSSRKSHFDSHGKPRPKKASMKEKDKRGIRSTEQPGNTMVCTTGGAGEARR